MRSLRVVSTVAVLLALAALSGCGSSTSYDAPSAPAAAPAPAAHDAEPAVAEGEHTHIARCGCSIEDIGECGNYIEVEDHYVALVLPEDAEVEKMAFCGKGDVPVKLEGEIQDDRFVATSFSFVE